MAPMISVKVLSRITTPTTGEAILNGRVGSLLEVGTGFHPELTGRENVYFNGTILGLKKHEIKARFDEIVAFSGIEEFIDTPIKRYSSGMKMRLAFSVAAHLEPEIMIIDEVLAVGDVVFQNKCLGKMREVASAGRTVLFVSHNMNAVMQLCSRIIWFADGKLAMDGNNVRMICQEYAKPIEAKASLNVTTETKYFRLLSFSATQATFGADVDVFVRDNDIEVHLVVEILLGDPSLNFGVCIRDSFGETLFWTCSTDLMESKWPSLVEGRNHLSFSIPANFLNEGSYVLEFFAALQYQEWLVEPGTWTTAIRFSISGPVSESPYWRSARPGPFAPILAWRNARD